MTEIPMVDDEGPKHDKLYRSREDRWISGVCGGIGKHLGIDPIIIRILWILFGFTIAGVIVYIICIFAIPEEPEW
jgi:phage shock protein C